MDTPYKCPDHPEAGVRYCETEDYYSKGRKLRKPRIETTYECAECGKVLARRILP